MKVKECLKGQAAKISWEAFDEFQQAEFDAQLAESEIEVLEKDEAVKVEIISPTNFNDPDLSDKHALAQVIRSKAKIVVVLYLSVLSDDLFEGLNAVCVDRVMANACADRVMATTLVDKLVSKID